MYIDLLFLLLLSLFLGFRLWSVLGKNAPSSRSRKKSNLFVVPREKVTIEKEEQSQEIFYPGFNESAFLTGAEKAFGQIHKAFITQDQTVLSKLIASEFLPRFLKQQEQNGGRYEAVCLLSIVIQEKKIEKGKAFIAVQLTSQKTYQEKIWTTEEAWVFRRSLSSTNLNWFLCDIH